MNIQDELAKLAGEMRDVGARFIPVTILKWADRLDAIREAMGKGEPEPVAFQSNVHKWMLACFGEEISKNTTERNHRFLEEALELVQALGCTQSEAHQLVDYVYGRPIGEPTQEAGGVMVTLAALCTASDLDMSVAGATELARVWTKVEAIRAKQAAKPKHSPLPIAAPPADSAQGLVDALKARADAEYVMAMKIANQPEAMGWVSKVKSGQFGQAEMQAHIQMNKCFGAHESIYAALAAHKSEVKAELSSLRELVKEMRDSSVIALTRILDQAEARDYDPPADGLAVAELEYAIAKADAILKEITPEVKNV